MAAVLRYNETWIEPDQPAASQPWACNVCAKGQGPRGSLQRVCGATGGLAIRAREHGGECGPDAKLMTFRLAEAVTLCSRCRRPVGITSAMRCPCLP